MVHNYKTWVEVSKKALLNNAEVVRGLIGPTVRIMAVVKSNAYGHGLVETAKMLTSSERFEVEPRNIPDVQPLGVGWLGVDNIDEAILLRENKIKNPILVLGHTPPVRFPEAVKHNLRLTVYNLFPPSLILNTGPLTHLKIDTGMSRQGILVPDLPKFLKSIPRWLPIEGVYTHFANADNLKDRSYPNLQLANFKKAIEILKRQKIEPQILHASATTGLLTMPEAHYGMVRVGIGLYGLWPSLKFKNGFKNLKIEPALSWKTRIVQIKKIKKGTPVGYGTTERVKKDTRIAVLPVGYYDGYMRSLSGKSHVLIGGRRCKILGRISMNLMVADISGVQKTMVGDLPSSSFGNKKLGLGEVVLIGTQGHKSVTAEELAEKASTISYEIVSRINPLLPRVYKN